MENELLNSFLFHHSKDGLSKVLGPFILTVTTWYPHQTFMKPSLDCSKRKLVFNFIFFRSFFFWSPSWTGALEHTPREKFFSIYFILKCDVFSGSYPYKWNPKVSLNFHIQSYFSHDLSYTELREVSFKCLIHQQWLLIHWRIICIDLDIILTDFQVHMR